jgi:trk system potassium uptake protein
MNIFVAGGGRVGFHLAKLLSRESNDITVIEADPDVAEQVDMALDARTVCGNAASIMLLREIGVGEAGVFVAVTGNDEVNLLAAATAKGLGAAQTVARVHASVYIESHILYETVLGIDYLLSPEALTALSIVQYMENPGIVAAEDFGRGMVQMRQVRVMKSPTTGGKMLKDLCPPGGGVLLGLISRNGKTFIPHGDTTLEAGDLAILIGHRDRIPHLQNLLRGQETRARSVMIMGGGGIGRHLAQLLDTGNWSVKLLDNDPGRCEYLASRLKKVKVLCHDATSRAALEQENVDQIDLFVATTGDDEHNIMASVLALEMGVARTIAVVHQPDFAPLVGKLGIDHAVTPRAALANRVLRLVHQDRVSTLAVLEEGQVEIIELNVEKPGAVTGRPLRETRSRFPQGSLVASIIRGDEIIVPIGDDRIEVGDTVVMIAALESVDTLHKMFLL